MFTANKAPNMLSFIDNTQDMACVYWVCSTDYFNFQGKTAPFSLVPEEQENRQGWRLCFLKRYRQEKDRWYNRNQLERRNRSNISVMSGLLRWRVDCTLKLRSSRVKLTLTLQSSKVKLTLRSAGPSLCQKRGRWQTRPSFLWGSNKWNREIL